MRKRYSLWVYLNYLKIYKLNNRDFVIMLSVFVGLAGGLVAYLLKTLVLYIHHYLLDNASFNRDNMLLLLYPILGVTITLVFRKYIIRDMVKHNVASVLYSISKRKSIMPLHKVFSSFIGGVLTAGFGGSIGLESPIISSGSAIGSNLGRLLRLNYKTVTLLLACGVAGAISAIFNTPIAAIVFALEVLLIDLTRFSLIPLLVASVCGAIFPNLLFEDAILFEFTIEEHYLSKEIPFYILLGVLCGLISIYFTRTFLWIERLFENLKNYFYRILIGGGLLGLLLYLFPPLYGEGYVTVKEILNGDYIQIVNSSGLPFLAQHIWGITFFFLVLIFLKVAATSITLGSGGVGGIFAPSLFTGSLLGLSFVLVLQSFGLGEFLPVSSFSLVAMAGVLSGVLHAPLTAIFLIAEVTQGYHLIIPLMVVTTISFLTVKVFEPNSIFTVQLAKRGELITHHKDKAVLRFLELKNVIETNVSVVPIEANLGDLVKIIAKSKRNIFPVVDDDGILNGIIYLENVREIMFNTGLYNKIYVSELMELPPSYIYYSDSMEEVVGKFTETNAWNLPVIDKAKYVGIVSKSKLFSVYRDLLVQLSED